MYHRQLMTVLQFSETLFELAMQQYCYAARQPLQPCSGAAKHPCSHAAKQPCNGTAMQHCQSRCSQAATRCCT